MFAFPDTCESCKSAGFLWGDSRFAEPEGVNNPLLVIFNEDGWLVSHQCLWSRVQSNNSNFSKAYRQTEFSPVSVLKAVWRLCIPASFSGHDVQCNEVKFQSLLEFWGSNFKEGWIKHKKVIQFLVNQIFATLKVGQNRSMCTDNA